MKAGLIVLALTGACTIVSAANSPYQGEETREIKALSAAEIDGLLRGDGLGFARAAELNHYPGPAHVLELAAELQLSAQQLAQTRAIYERMNAAARQLGSQLVEGEKTLNALFARGEIDATDLDLQLSALGDIRARLRGVHLRAHLEQRALLSPHQVHRYDELRGYRGGAHAHGDSHQGHN